MLCQDYEPEDESDDAFPRNPPLTTLRWPRSTEPENDMRTNYLAYFRGTDIRNGETKPRYGGKNLTERVSFILQSYPKFSPMSNNYMKWVPDDEFKKGPLDPESYGSLEDCHKTLHNYSGGEGHMSSTEISAFDPVFWLHHW